MIQANELRLGNWVRLFQSDEPYKIHVISRQVVQVESDLIGGEVFNIAHIQPISLTPEVLDKCGFEWQTYDDITAFAYKDTPIVAYWDGVEWCLKYGYDSDLTFAACNYLHQLQNIIYFLSGEEINYKP